jgi:tRNA(Ile)-lysidine synthase
MHIAAAVSSASIAAVACFDHGTGAHATRAVSLVSLRARDLGLPFVAARSPGTVRKKSEAKLREARWDFLRGVARTAGDRDADVPAVATAHTRDDQIETVAMRIMRGSGARGLAALYAESRIVRPLLEHSRAEIEAWAAEHGMPFVQDPTNESREYLRNRLRHDLLPALRRADPELDAALLDLSQRAARLRRETEHFARRLDMQKWPDGRTEVMLTDVRGIDAPGLAVLLPAIVARAGVRLDRKGIALLAAFLTDSRRSRGSIQLSGAVNVEHRGDRIVIAHSPAPSPPVAQRMRGNTAWGDWRFTESRDIDTTQNWCAWLPRNRSLSVRAWRPGDRIRAEGADGLRRVKRFLSDAGIAGADRSGWPVVLVDDTIVWIPGVRRSEGLDLSRGDEESIGYVAERTGG